MVLASAMPLLLLGVAFGMDFVYICGNKTAKT